MGELPRPKRNGVIHGAIIGVQLELDFESAIALARQDPVQMELFELLDRLVPSLEGLDREETLRLAGQRFMELAELLEQKAEAIYKDLRDRHNDEGPIPDDDFLAGLVQETMFLDVSGVVRSPKVRKKVETEVVESSVTEMDKEELLLLLEAADVEVDPAPPLSIEELEYDENIGAWIQLVHEFLGKCGDDVLFSELIGQRLLPRGKAWLAVLLGGFHLDQQGDFYEGVIRVRSLV